MPEHTPITRAIEGLREIAIDNPHCEVLIAVAKAKLPEGRDTKLLSLGWSKGDDETDGVVWGMESMTGG